MKKLFVITGADGHLGNTLIRILCDTFCDKNSEDKIEIRGLILENECVQDTDKAHYIKGDVRKKESLRPLFEKTKDKEVYVIHTAGIISIAEHVSPELYEVNVNGTKNVIGLCLEYRVKRLVYVSSVHAIPEKDKVSVLTEVEHFSAEEVVGAYAKTKAEATQAVLDAGSEGLDVVVVHPSGILGPYDRSGNHLVQLVTDYIDGLLPACVKGGYDFVDVRDVACGCLLAAQKGRAGECYILSNRHYEIRDVLEIARMYTGGKKLPVLPMWMAKAAVPVIQWTAGRKQKRPLYTAYSLYTLQSNDRFSHDKATRELGYMPRDFVQTMKDTVQWHLSDGR